jgi:hypothetical protein
LGDFVRDGELTPDEVEELRRMVDEDGADSGMDG